ncbi:MAG TPA: diacylglycerol kinase family protein [Thermoanaerobaculia bacterium]|nr:diacylglycerol kinase family protein [Thermoanaerobaculia bacterium]
MPPKGTLFLNRNSGPRADAEALIEAARAAELEVVEISPELDCTREIRERVSRGTKLFIAAGGDGTIHHVVQGVARTDAVLAVIPTGTYNHFARDLDIPLDWQEALAVALGGEHRQIDVARINDRYFVNNVSLGLYPELVARREERGRDYARWKALLYAFYVTLRKYRHVTLAVESDALHESIRTHVFMVSNNRYDLERVGAEAPRPTLTEGKLGVYWLPHTSRLRLMRFVTRYLRGAVRQIPGFRSFRTTRMRVQCARPALAIGVDGELFTLPTPLVLTSFPRSLTVCVPREDGTNGTDGTDGTNKVP